jgi:ankyrin repeat protein
MSFRSLKEDAGRLLDEDRKELISHVKHGKCRTRSMPVLFDTENRDINATDNQGRTSLFCAVKYGETEMVKYLLDKGANPDIADTSMTFPLHEAIDNAYLDIVQLLVDYGKYK